MGMVGTTLTPNAASMYDTEAWAFRVICKFATKENQPVACTSMKSSMKIDTNTILEHKLMEDSLLSPQNYPIY